MRTPLERNEEPVANLKREGGGGEIKTETRSMVRRKKGGTLVRGETKEKKCVVSSVWEEKRIRESKE